MFRLYLTIINFVFLLSCATPNAEQIAFESEFKAKYIQSSTFKIFTYQKILKPGANLSLYIEGDGYAWIHNTKLSSDPTPRTPLLIKLASLDTAANVIYIARPCQHCVEDLKTICNNKYWSSARYSKTVVDSINEVIDQIKTNTKASKIRLIGYSGGAAIAMLIAAERHDVQDIRTIAGNLDLQAMQKFHHTTPLTESLDPLNVAFKNRAIPQLHFVGKKDSVVPPIIAKNFCARAKLDEKHIILLDSVGHHNGWVQNWPELLKYVP